MTELTLWKGLCVDFSPDPVKIDDLIGKRLRKSGLKGSRTRGKCTFASTCKSQAENYTNGPGTLVQVAPEPGAILTWSPDAADLILNFESFLSSARWDACAWATPRARDIIHDVMGCISTFEEYLRMQPHSRVIPQIIDRWLDQISVYEVDFSTSERMAEDLSDHTGEVWITGPCRLISSPQTTALPEPKAA